MGTTLSLIKTITSLISKDDASIYQKSVNSLNVNIQRLSRANVNNQALSQENVSNSINVNRVRGKIKQIRLEGFKFDWVVQQHVSM